MNKVTDLTLNRTKYTKCGCGSEVLIIEYDHELNIADLCIFESKSSHMFKNKLWSRVRYAIRALISGPYTDQIELSKKDLIDIKKFIEDVCLE